MMTFQDYLDAAEEVPEMEVAFGDDSKSGRQRFAASLMYASNFLLEAKQEIDHPGSVGTGYSIDSALDQVKEFVLDAIDFRDRYANDPAKGNGAHFL